MCKNIAPWIGEGDYTLVSSTAHVWVSRTSENCHIRLHCTLLSSTILHLTSCSNAFETNLIWQLLTYWMSIWGCCRWPYLPCYDFMSVVGSSHFSLTSPPHSATLKLGAPLHRSPAPYPRGQIDGLTLIFQWRTNKVQTWSWFVDG